MHRGECAKDVTSPLLLYMNDTILLYMHPGRDGGDSLVGVQAVDLPRVVARDPAPQVMPAAARRIVHLGRRGLW